MPRDQFQRLLDDLREDVLAYGETVVERFRVAVAGDLRFVAASFKILTDLERVADLAVNLAAYVHTTDETLFPSVSFGDVGEMAAEMLEDALAVYADPSPDPEGCFRVADRDDELD